MVRRDLSIMSCVIVGLLIFIPVYGGAEDFSVLHLNAWSGLERGGVFVVPSYEEAAARDFRAALIADGLAESQADLITIAEANPLPIYSDRLAEQLQYDAQYQVANAGVRIGVVGLPANLRMGHVILADPSRGMANVGSRALSGGGAGNLFAWNLSETSIVFGVRVQVGGGDLYIFTLQLHESPFAYEADLVALAEAYGRGELSSRDYIDTVRAAVRGRERRRAEIERAIVYINDISGQSPVILTGSFAARPDSGVLTRLYEAGFRDSYAEQGAQPGYTRDETSNTNIERFQTGRTYGVDRSRVDYILYRGDNLVATRSELVFEEAVFGVHPSDHFGIHSYFRIEDAE